MEHTFLEQVQETLCLVNAPEPHEGMAEQVRAMRALGLSSKLTLIYQVDLDCIYN